MRNTQHIPQICGWLFLLVLSALMSSYKLRQMSYQANHLGVLSLYIMKVAQNTITRLGTQ